MNGVIYSGELDGEKLKILINELFGESEAFRIEQEIETYMVGDWEASSQELASRGSVFSEKGEIRWERSGERYSALIIADEVLENLPSEFKLVYRELKEEELTFHLEPPTSPRISPNFKEYPKSAKKIRAKVLYKNSVPIIVSPRGFEK